MEGQGYEVEAQNTNVLGSSEEINHQAQGYEVEAQQNSNVLGSSEEANHQDQGYEVEAQNTNVLGSSEEANHQSRNSNARADCGIPRPNSLPENPSYSPPQSIQGSSPMHYDPTRIPASIFAKTTPAEWSVASNESLFSIHVGTQSFSVLKSGELTMVNEYSSPAPVSDSAPLPPLAPAVVDKPISIQPSPTLVSKKPDNVDTNKNANTKKRDSTTPEMQAQAKDNVPNSPSISCTSRDSHISTQSFVFPVLASRNASTRVGLEEEKQSQPQQMARQPSQEKAEPQTSTQTETPNAAWCGLFSCFSCYRFC